MPEIPAECLLESDTVTIRDVRCRGHQAHQGDEESTTATHLVLPYAACSSAIWDPIRPLPKRIRCCFSTAPRALGSLKRIAEEIKQQGTWRSIEETFYGFAEAEALFARPRTS